MAKRKKPVSIFNLPKEEVMKASSDIISKTKKEDATPPSVIEDKPKEAPAPKPVRKKTAANKAGNSKKPKKKVIIDPNAKRKFLYVDESHHQQAKINAAIKGMKLQEYIAWLIINDTQK